MENRNTGSFHLAIIIINFAVAHLLWQQIIKLPKKKYFPAFILLYVKNFKPCMWAV
jgi:hypothetical protein